MSQMPQQAALSKCPSCEEPLESGDRFCGACGYDLSVVPARPADEPTIAMNGTVPPQAAVPPAWPPPAAGAVPPRPATPPPGPPSPGPYTAPGAHPAVPGPHAASGGHATGVGASGDGASHRAAPGVHAPAPSGSVADGPPHPAAPHAPTAHASNATPGAPAHPAAADPHPPAPSAHTAPAGDAASADRSAPSPGAPAQAGAAPTGARGAPVQGQPAASAAPPAGVRLDRRAPAEGAGGGDDYPLQAPDPRVAAEPAAVCVACRAGRVDDDGYCENCGHAQPRERDHMEQECGPVAAVSDRGLRHHRNEDAFAVGTTALPDGSPVSVAVVCDGVSSATRPDEASLAASRAANASLLDALPRGTHPQQAMHEAILAASEAVNALAGEQPAEADEHAPQQNAPACTIVGAVVTAGLLVVGWVGDSRAYWIPVDRSPAVRLTEDDSWAAQMVAAGLMGEAEAYADHRAHAITGWLGADAYELEPHTAAFKPDRPGVVVVCTDGLWNYAESADEMAEAVPADAAARPLHAARVLVGHALDGGGHDNVTVALVPFPAVPQGAGSA
ncbi:PP2C family serine/threonine-protein phosphatase [Streptomyces sp. F-7]|uniref:PP2C family serine/threonine-protein phosphatase n=1 Tax=Streptomyces sp. F-7 TaxID=573566 RepID=UPI00159EEFA1|nr:protein phosphatase 2C domain-containing protein [Streptomyces sp. F-7]